MANKELSEKVEKMVGRILILRDICDAKDTLFGPFGADRTLSMKSKIWNEILEKAKTFGLVAPCKDYKYMRDIYWQNIKRHSLSKRENSHKYGKKYKKTAIDEIVFEIFDNTSTLHQQSSLPTDIKSLSSSTAKTTAPTPDLDFELIDDNTIVDNVDIIIEKVDYSDDEYIKEEKEELPEYDALSDVPPQPAQPLLDPELSQGQAIIDNNTNQKTKEGNLRKKKMLLEMEFLKLQNYKTQLEVLDLETKLGIKPSEFTKELAKKRRMTNIVYENGVSEDSD